MIPSAGRLDPAVCYSVWRISPSEHDPTKVSDLRRLGMVVYLAKKGELSEWNGILKCKRFRTFYVFDKDVKKELTTYRFEEINGLLTNKVVKTKDYHYWV